MTDTDIASQVNNDLVMLLYKRFHFYIIAESLAAIVYVILLWSIVDHTLLIVWLAFILIVDGLLRHILTYAYHHYKKLDQINNIDIWKKLFYLGTMIAGILWAASGYFFIATNSNEYRIVILLVLMCLIGASNTVYLPIKSVYLASVVPVFIALLIILILQDNLIYSLFYFGVVIFIYLTQKLAFGATDALSNSLWLQYKNDELVENIKETNDNLALTNEKLQTEITARYHAEMHLQELATHDPLTGLSNRIMFYKQMTQLLQYAKKGETHLALLMLDLDHFKKINDTFGHDMGDKLLIEAGKRLQHGVRKTDTISRLGGDEFCIILDEFDKITDIERIAVKLCTDFRRPFFIAEHTLELTISIGISIYPTDGDDTDTLIKNADIALYQAKDTGRDQYVFFK